MSEEGMSSNIISTHYRFMDNIIKKAVSAGYEIGRYYYDENGSWDYDPDEVTLMNREFWICLGRACGWDDPVYKGEYCIANQQGSITRKCEWELNAIQFHTLNLTKSLEDAVAWLESIVNK